jgi:hypothetical protein
VSLCEITKKNWSADYCEMIIKNMGICLVTCHTVPVEDQHGFMCVYGGGGMGSLCVELPLSINCKQTERSLLL